MISQNNQNNISELLTDLLKAHGIDEEKLSHLTNIPKRFINALKGSNFSALPAEPYIRGYLIKIATVLKVEPIELINAYKESVGQKRRNESDKPPMNRFKQMPISKGWLLAGVIAILIGTFLFFRLDAILGVPELSVNVPTETSVESLTVEGQIRPRDTLTINGEIVYTDEVGNFKHDVLLQPGVNTLDFRVKRFLGRETKVIKQVNYQPIINLPDNGQEKSGGQ